MHINLIAISKIFLLEPSLIFLEKYSISLIFLKDQFYKIYMINQKYI